MFVFIYVQISLSHLMVKRPSQKTYHIFSNMLLHEFLQFFLRFKKTRYQIYMSISANYLILVFECLSLSLNKLACPTGWYDANCDRECHCSSLKCNPALGCIDTNECEAGYRENFCQGIIYLFILFKKQIS